MQSTQSSPPIDPGHRETQRAAQGISIQVCRGNAQQPARSTRLLSAFHTRQACAAKPTTAAAPPRPAALAATTEPFDHGPADPPHHVHRHRASDHVSEGGQAEQLWLEVEERGQDVGAPRCAGRIGWGELLGQGAIVVQLRGYSHHPHAGSCGGSDSAERVLHPEWRSVSRWSGGVQAGAQVSMQHTALRMRARGAGTAGAAGAGLGVHLNHKALLWCHAQPLGRLRAAMATGSLAQRRAWIA